MKWPYWRTDQINLPLKHEKKVNEKIHKNNQSHKHKRDNMAKNTAQTSDVCTPIISENGENEFGWSHKGPAQFKLKRPIFHLWHKQNGPLVVHGCALLVIITPQRLSNN